MRLHRLSLTAFGPFAGLATGLGLGWLATLLYADAFISPAGTGLVYSASSSRLSFALSRNGYKVQITKTAVKRAVLHAGGIRTA